MGNCRSVCGLDLISSQDLTHSSLNVNPIRRQKVSSRTVILQKDSPQTRRNDSLMRKGRSYGEILEKSWKRLNTDSPKEKPMTIDNNFKILKLLKDSKFGKVCLVKKESQQNLFVMKIMCKKRLSNRFFNPMGMSMIEKEILEKSCHPFIPRLAFSFENERKTFMVTDYIEGGSIRTILHQLSRFSEEITRFYCAEVLLTLEYLHEKVEVSYNDLRPENILVDSDGHIKLINFGSADKLTSLDTSISTSDSPRSAGSEQSFITGKMKDYWGFGCFMYEILTGNKPFQGSLEWPQNVSKNARDLITRLFDQDIEKRLGYQGIQEIKQHIFFSGINWDKILQKTVYPPLNPFHVKKQEEEDDDIENESEEDPASFISCNTQNLAKLGTPKAFAGYETLGERSQAKTFTEATRRPWIKQSVPQEMRLI